MFKEEEREKGGEREAIGGYRCHTRCSSEIKRKQDAPPFARGEGNPQKPAPPPLLGIPSRSLPLFLPSMVPLDSDLEEIGT